MVLAAAGDDDSAPCAPACAPNNVFSFLYHVLFCCSADLDYADAFCWGDCRLGHAPVWLALGILLYWAYPILKSVSLLL